MIHVDFSDHGYDRSAAARLSARARPHPAVRPRAGGAFGLSVLRSDPHSPFAGEESNAGPGRRTAGGHAGQARRRLPEPPNVAQALTALPEIETCIVATSDLPRREAEVCARILYGLSSVGIALDLTVSEETVKTYRKRAYQRLAIGSERELLTWYLARWSRWSAERFLGAGTSCVALNDSSPVAGTDCRAAHASIDHA
jgi:DNA-binding CsgD family transcriptional regulator